MVTGPNRPSRMTRLGESREEAQEPTTPLITPKTRVTIGSWNVRTMFAAGKSAQIAKEMKQQKIEILGISESRWNGSGRTKLTTGETILYSGRQEDDNNHIHGVAIMLSNKAENALIDWAPINERIISARFYSKFLKLTVIHAYAPTNESDEIIKDEFYEILNEQIRKTPKHDILIVTGDFNAKVGNQPEPYQEIMGRHGEGDRNENGEKLCEFCANNELIITGTLFPHKRIHKLTWTSPNGKTKNQIDHVLVRKKFRSSVMDTRVFRSADIGSDHYLVKTFIKTKLKRAPKGEENRLKYDTDCLKNETIRKEFCIKLKNRYEILETESISENCETDTPELEQMNRNLEDAYNTTAKEVLGYKKKKTKPWISQETWNLISQRKEINNQINSTRSARIKDRLQDDYKGKDKEVKKQIKNDKKKWVDNIAKDAEEAAAKNHMKTLYGLTKVLTNERPKRCVTIKDKEEKDITHSEDRKKRWREHFQEILNREEPNNPLVEDTEVEEGTGIEDINTDPPTLMEIHNAIKTLKNGKAAGDDKIQAELLKADINFTSKKIEEILNKVWEQEKTPNSWKRGLIIKLPKKGNLKNCKNWRGITLLPVVSKVLGRIIIDRIRKGVDHKLRKEQAGYRSNRNTTDQIFILRNIIEQSNEWQSSLYVNFIDFEKAFDSIHRESLWKIMKIYGIPMKIINIVKALYENFECAVLEENEKSEWFKIKTGVKQGCNMSGFLFLIVIDWVMRKTTGSGENGIRWKFTKKLDDLDFADDIALLSTTHRQMQLKTDSIIKYSAQVGLKANREKCKILKINTKNTEVIKMNMEPIEEVKKFEYLGAIVAETGGGTMDLNNRLRKARATFVRLKNVWNSSNYKRKTKIRLYKTLVKPVLMYGSETWKMTDSDNHKLDVFQSKCLRQILKIRWQDHVSNESVMERAGIEMMSKEVKKKRWKYIGHVLRREQGNDCTTALTWAPEGKRKVGRPKTTWRRTVERERNEAGWKTWNQARATALDRAEWRLRVEALCASRHTADR